MLATGSWSAIVFAPLRYSVRWPCFETSAVSAAITTPYLPPCTYTSSLPLYRDTRASPAVKTTYLGHGSVRFKIFCGSTDSERFQAGDTYCSVGALWNPPSKCGGRTDRVLFPISPSDNDLEPTVPGTLDCVNGLSSCQQARVDSPLCALMAVRFNFGGEGLGNATAAANTSCAERRV